MNDLVKLLAEHVVLGEPLPFDALDGRGMLLLKKGVVVASESQLERLLERGMYVGGTEFAALFGEQTPARLAVQPVVLVSAWGRLLKLQADLAALLAAVAAGSASGIQPTLVAMALEVRDLCSLDADAMLASISLLRHPSYSARHALCTALLLELMLRHTPVPDAQRQSVVAGALLMNAGMLALQDELYSQKDPLTDAQKVLVEAHPLEGDRLLRAAGADDEVTLTAVARHHELADGTGYPSRVKAPELDLSVQAIVLADRYCALVSERGYRAGAPTDQVLKLLQVREVTTLAPILLRLLAAEVGAYPPGCPVRLVNNESGIVLRRMREPGSRVVKVLRSALNALYEDGPRRLTGQSAYAVDRVIRLADLGVEVDPMRLWDETARIGGS